jgi:hypothetical protein
MVHKSKLAFIAAPSPRRQSLPAHVCGIIQMLPREFGSIMHPAVSRCRYSSGEAAVPLRAQASDEVIEKDTVCCSAWVRNFPAKFSRTSRDFQQGPKCDI